VQQIKKLKNLKFGILWFLMVFNQFLALVRCCLWCSTVHPAEYTRY